MESEELSFQPLDRIKERMEPKGVTAVLLDELEQLRQAGRLTDDEYEQLREDYLEAFEQDTPAWTGLERDELLEKFENLDTIEPGDESEKQGE